MLIFKKIIVFLFSSLGIGLISALTPENIHGGASVDVQGRVECTVVFTYLYF